MTERRLEQFERLAALARQEAPPPLDVSAEVMTRVAAPRGKRHIVALRPPAPRRFWSAGAAAGLAAVLVLGAFFAWTRSTANNAQAALSRAIAAEDRSHDRTYRIEVEHRGALGIIARPRARLFVRGGDRFLLQRPSLLLPGDVLAGSNGKQFWVVPALGSVVLHDDLSAPPPWFIGGDDVSMPLLHLRTLLSRLEARYDMELLDSEPLPNDATRWQRVQGRRRATTERGPDVIDLWVHPKSGLAQRAVLSWDAQRNALTPRQITIELVDERPLPADWFEHAAHHRPERPVRHVGE